MGVIYLRTNNINGMQYVGQAVDFKRRECQWNNLKWSYANQLLTDDRNKYGLDSFESTILKECDDSELDEWERHFIKEFDTIYPNGYNDNEGGSIGFHHSDRTKQKISESKIGKEPWNKGKTYDEIFDEETATRLKKVMSDFAKTRVGEKNPFYGKKHEVHPMQGKHHSDETKRKIGDANRNGKTSTPIVQVKDDGTIIEWPSLQEASRNGYDCGSISKAVRGIYYSSGHHYKDSYWYEKEEYNKKLLEELTS